MNTRQSFSDLDIDRLNATITIDEIKKRIDHEIWATNALADHAGTKVAKLRAQHRTQAFELVLGWIAQYCPDCGDHHTDCLCPRIGAYLK